MPTHILVNGLGLTHKSSTGFSKATIPDICKTPTPGGPVPMPYPNFAMSSTLTNGTTTVFAKGGKMIAVKGSRYTPTNGDEPGTVGGVKSNTFKQGTDWITYSFDVKMDGKNSCRDTDKKFHNDKNTVDLMGNMNPAFALSFDQAKGLLCAILCECKAEAQAKKFEVLTPPSAFEAPDFGSGGAGSPGKAANQACVERKLRKDYGETNLIPEQSYDMTKSPPAPVPGKPPGTRRPDVVLVHGSGPAQAPNIDVFEMKFPPDSYGNAQEEDYERIGGGKPVTTLSPKDCGC